MQWEDPSTHNSDQQLGPTIVLNPLHNPQQRLPHYQPDAFAAQQLDITRKIATPPKQFSYSQAASPFSGPTVWGYTLFLFSCLVTFMVYLLLPRGLRKQYCSARPKRYARTDDADMPAAGYWLPVKRQQGKQPPQPQQANSNQYRNLLPGISQAAPHPDPYQTPERPKKQGTQAEPPSPNHPALHKIPSNKIIAETMARLQGRGIRLVAHGVHCQPKRVWIKLDDDDTSVTWQTEFPRRVPSQSGQVSIVLMRGSLHRIALCNVLYIDVGKKTNAMQQLPEKVPDPCCFSLLTQNGSLDLQANSKLERDALVSCFSMVLDDVHVEDWRAIYEASPEPSLVNSSLANGNATPLGLEETVGKGTLVL